MNVIKMYTKVVLGSDKEVPISPEEVIEIIRSSFPFVSGAHLHLRKYGALKTPACLLLSYTESEIAGDWHVFD